MCSRFKVKSMQKLSSAVCVLETCLSVCTKWHRKDVLKEDGFSDNGCPTVVLVVVLVVLLNMVHLLLRLVMPHLLHKAMDTDPLLMQNQNLNAALASKDPLDLLGHPVMMVKTDVMEIREVMGELDVTVVSNLLTDFKLSPA